MKIAAQFTLSMVFGLVFFGVALFLPAWTFHYWQAWVFIAVFMTAALVSGLYLAVTAPEALQRRLHAGPTAEPRPLERLIISATVAAVMALVIVSALDHRYGWSSVPAAVSVIGAVLVATGLTLAQLVVIQNNYAAANIVVEDGQALVSTGLYRFVRHPMYFGVLVMLLGTPLALGSFWGLLVLIPTVLVLAARIVDEETLLNEELNGYREYRTRVRYRLIPHLW